MLHQCLGITQKGEQCKKMLKCGGYCFMHTPKELDDRVELVDLDELVEQTVISNVETPNDTKIIELNAIIDQQKTEINKMREICRAYNCIRRFEVLKTKIKSIVTFTKNFYINDIVYDKQYHDVIKSEFGMSPFKLRELYFQLREQRNEYAHPKINLN
jgi:hypothetical protein